MTVSICRSFPRTLLSFFKKHQIQPPAVFDEMVRSQNHLFYIFPVCKCRVNCQVDTFLTDVERSIQKTRSQSE